jgi:hypothetical protein
VSEKTDLMKKNSQNTLVLLVWLVLISCRLLSPTPEPNASAEERVAHTMAAMQADQDQAEPTIPPDTQEPIDPMAVTDDACEPTAQVIVGTNCRVGPGQAYDIVTALSIGQTARVIGRNAEETYWIIHPPGGSGHCWLWGKHTTVTCATADLTIYEPPPTPTPLLPTATHTPTVPASPDRTEPDFWCDQHLTLSPNSFVNLANCTQLSSSGGHLLFTDDYKFRPLSATSLGIVMVHDVLFDDCYLPSGMSYSEIHRDTLGYNSRVCFRTVDNRIGYFYIVSMDQPANGWIEIHIRTWLTHR